MERRSDETLIALLLAGDATALAPLVARHHRPLLGYLYHLVGGDRALADDLTQETFARLLRPATYQPGRPFKPWLYAIATNLARDHFRSAAIARTTTGSDASMLERHDPAPGPEEWVLATEQRQLVGTALSRLGPEYRAALLLRFYHDLSLREIADALGVPLGTVKSRLSVGTHRLRDLLAAEKEGLQR